MVERPPIDPSRGVYGISVAAELAGMGVQNLRLYEARGLLQPARTDGGTRRYSPDDLDRLHRIGQLLDDGLNLVGSAWSSTSRLKTAGYAPTVTKTETARSAWT